MMAGLQGAGKTTSVAKLARYLKEREKKSVLVVSADIYRPAAINQLETLAGEVDASFYPSSTDQDPVTIANNAVDEARRRFIDVVIVDTAGRMHVDEGMMDEIGRLNKAVSPNETLFVVDAMSGQDAANTAKAFSDALPLSGVILTKADGDAWGVQRCLSVISPDDPSSSWVWVRKRTRWKSFTRTVSPRGSWAWAMCCR